MWIKEIHRALWHSVWKSSYPDLQVSYITCYVFHILQVTVLLYFSPQHNTGHLFSSIFLTVLWGLTNCLLEALSASTCSLVPKLILHVLVFRYGCILFPGNKFCSNYSKRQTMGAARNFTTSLWSSLPRFRARTHRCHLLMEVVSNTLTASLVYHMWESIKGEQVWRWQFNSAYWIWDTQVSISNRHLTMTPDPKMRGLSLSDKSGSYENEYDSLQRSCEVRTEEA